MIEAMLGLLRRFPEDQRDDAARVLAIDKALKKRARKPGSGKLVRCEADQSLRKELQQVVERLARRESLGIPFATLGRSLLADLWGYPTDSKRHRIECDATLKSLGLL